MDITLIHFLSGNIKVLEEKFKEGSALSPNAEFLENLPRTGSADIVGMLPCTNLHTTSCIRILFSSTAPGKLYFGIGRCEQDSNGRIYNEIKKRRSRCIYGRCGRSVCLFGSYSCANKPRITSGCGIILS